MTITRVQGNARGITNRTPTLSISLTNNPIQNHLLILTSSIAGNSYNGIDHITQTGVIWTKQVGYNNSPPTSEIWAGVVGASASKNITVYITDYAGDGCYGTTGVLNVCEYSGLVTADFLDRTATANGYGYSHNTGTTTTTTQAHELWIGCVSSWGNVNQSSPTNDFSLLDGVSTPSPYVSNGFLDFIASSTGQANAHTTAGSNTFSGCIATFKGLMPNIITATADSHSTISPAGNIAVNAGANVTFNLSANPGYQITHVYVDNVDQGIITSYTFNTINTNHTITCETTQNANAYIIAASSDSYSTISPSGNIPINAGGNHTFNLAASPGHHITDVYVDGVSQGVITSYTFNTINTNHTITVNSTQDLIKRVQGNSRGLWTSGNSISTILTSQPSSGNVLIAVVGIYSNPAGTQVSSISQTGVTWARQVQNFSNGTLEIWAGVVGANALPNLTVNLSNTASISGVVDVCEYSGILPVSFLDLTATNNGGFNTATDAGTIATTAQAGELWIGATLANSSPPVSQSTPRNGFILLDGQPTSWSFPGISIAYLEKIVVNIGTANTGTTASSNCWWAGCLAAFKAPKDETFTGTLTIPAVTVNGNAKIANLNVSSGLAINGNAGNSGQVLTSNGSGTAPTWQPASGGGPGVISSIASGAPFAVTGGAISLNTSSPMQVTNSTLTLPQANTSTNGYLSSTDWNTFNNKQNGLTIGNLSGTVNQVTVSGGTGTVIGSGATLSLPQNIHTGAQPTFAGLTISGNASAANLNVISGLTFNGSAGNSGQVLVSSGSGAPTWQTISGSGGAIANQWTAGTVTVLDPNYFQIVNYAPNTISRTGYNRFTQSGNMTLSGTVAFTPTSGQKLIMTHISDGPTISNITQTGVTWSRITSYGYWVGTPAVVTEIWIGTIESGASTNFMVTYSSMNGYYTQCASLCDIMQYVGLDASPVEYYTNNPFFSGSPTDTGSISTANPNDLIIGMIGMSSSVTQTTPKNGFTLLSGAYANGISLATLELMSTVTGFHSSGTSTNGGTYVGMIVALKASVQNAEQRLTMVGSGGGSGGSLSASSPLQLSNNQLSIPQANISTNGYLASSDWNTFTSKQNALTIGNLSGTANQVNVSGGTGAVIGSGVTLSLPQSIHTGASPTFAGLTINGNPNTNNLNVNAGLTFNGNAGTAGQILTSNGSGNTPSWQSPSTGRGSWSASPVSSVGAGVKINGTQLQLDPTYSPTFAGLTLNSVMTSNASGSYPQPYSNAGMILDFYPTTHSEGLGIQPGGPWIKYGTTFNIYRDNGTSVLTAVSIDENRAMTINGSATIAGNLTVQSPSGVWSAILNHNSGQGQLNLKNGTINAYITRWTDRLEICDPALIRFAPAIGGNPMLVIDTVNGILSTRHNNILDDSSGNTTITGNAIIKTVSMEEWDEYDRGQFIYALDKHTFSRNKNCIKFYDQRFESELEQRDVQLHGVLVDNDPTLVCNRHLAVEKDVVAKGMFDSLEGEVALNAGDLSPGWGPYTRNPFVWLAQADKDENNTDVYSKLEIRKVVDYNLGDSSVDPTKWSNLKWGWGDIACGAINLHSKKLTTAPTFDDAALIFWDDSVKKLSLSYDTSYDLLYLWDHLYNSGQGRTIMSITHDGNLGVLGNITIGAIPTKSSVSGALYASAVSGSIGTICYNGSSLRYKTNVEDLNDCSWIYSLRPVTFKPKDAASENKQIGLIAEEVNQVNSQLVFQNTEGAPEGVHYEWLGVPILVELQKLRSRVDTLERQLKHNRDAS